jgi:hypothetical protein
MADFTNFAGVSTGGSASSPGSWVNPSPAGGGATSLGGGGIGLGVRAAAGGGGFGQLVPFDPNTVYPPIGGGKWPNKVEPGNPGGSGGGGGGDGGSSDSGAKGEKAEPEQRENERALKRRKGDPDKKLRQPEKVNPRVKGKNKAHASKHLGIKSMDQEGGNNAQNADPASLPNSQIPDLGGLAQNISTAVPAMQELLQNIPNEILGQFLNQLPGPLQSLIPSNLIPGIGNSGAVNLNNIFALAGSGALGGVGNALFNNILTSTGIPIETLQLLNPAAISQLGAGLNQIANASAIAQLMSSVQMASGVIARNGPPINPAVLNQLMGSILQSNGAPIQGVGNLASIAGNLNASPLGNILNAGMGGSNGVGQPLLPSNLSNPPAALLNGLGQQLPQELLQNFLNPNQIMSMLPPQLQAMLPVTGASNNLISQFANSSPERVPGSNVGRGDQGSKKSKKKEALNDGKHEKGMHELDYAQMLSSSFDLFQLSSGSGVEPGNGKIYKKQSEVDEVIKNLSTLAVNVLEPIREAYPTMVIHSGFSESGDHSKGKAVDIGFNVSPTRLMEIADWVRQNVPYKELQMNFAKKGWLHIVYDGSSSGGGGVSTNSPAGLESGLVNRFG